MNQVNYSELGVVLTRELRARIEGTLAQYYNPELYEPHMVRLWDRITNLYSHQVLIVEEPLAERLLHEIFISHFEIVWWKLQKRAQMTKHNFKLSDLYISDNYNSKYDNQQDTAAESMSSQNYGYRGFGADNQSNTYKKDNDNSTSTSGSHNRGTNKSVRYKQSLAEFNSYFQDTEIKNEIKNFDSKIKELISIILL